MSYDEYEELLDEDFEPEPKRKKKKAVPERQLSAVGAPKGQRAVTGRPGPSRASQTQPPRRGPKHVKGRAATGRRYRRRSTATRWKIIIAGLGAALVVLIALFVMAERQIGFFAPAGSIADSSQAGDKPIPIDQKRYSQLKAEVQANPQNFAALFDLGEMTFEAFRWEESISWLERALEINPNDVIAIQDVGTANFNIGNRSKALEMWLRALQVDPNNAQTHWNLGFYYANDQPPNMIAATQEWQKVLQFAPPSSRLYQFAQSALNEVRAP
ncbi:MAG: tetratricopeptide repeat protein [Chloroflexota bacterium]|nr:MAG: tetratricopeptide repeat protein [Chloroflexota bacterium]